MEVYSVYALKLGDEDNYWEWETEVGGKIIVFRNFQEDVEEELIGVFSSEVKAKAAIQSYLTEFDIEEMYAHPLRGITIMKHTVDVMEDNPVIKWVLGSESNIPQMPYL